MQEFPPPSFVPDDHHEDPWQTHWRTSRINERVPLPAESDMDCLSYVAACSCGAWHLVVWPKDDPAQRWAGQFKCRSWRHQGDCRLWKGAQDFVRCREAMESHTHWTHVVLTFEQPAGSDPQAMFRQGVHKWAKLRKRLARKFDVMRYIQTWERHRSGFPHVHLAITNKGLFHSANSSPIANWQSLIQDHAVKSGFGPIGWCERLRSAAAMAGYLNKLARELTGKGVDYQVPVNAPRNFRRLRASVRLLPPVHKNPDITGFIKFYKLPP
jgi:hypothetical protein